MTALLQLPRIAGSLVLSLYFLVFIALIFLPILRLTRLRRLRCFPVCTLLTLTFSFIIVCLMEGLRQMENALSLLGPAAPIWNLPWLIHAFILTGTMVFSGVGLIKERNVAETEITPDSIREALDNLPSGLCFSDHNGLPLLTNRRMYELAGDVDGSLLQNTEVFWQSLADFKGRDGIQRLQDGSSPVLRWPDGSVWRFSKTEFVLSGRRYIQTMAANITNFYQLSEQLAQSNADLERQQKRLKKTD